MQKIPGGHAWQLSSTPISIKKRHCWQSQDIDDPRNRYSWGRRLPPKSLFSSVLCFTSLSWLILILFGGIDTYHQYLLFILRSFLTKGKCIAYEKKYSHFDYRSHRKSNFQLEKSAVIGCDVERNIEKLLRTREIPMLRCWYFCRSWQKVDVRGNPSKLAQ